MFCGKINYMNNILQITSINNFLMTLKDYEFLAKIGAGKYSSVYKVKRVSDGKILALKKVPVHQMDSKSKKNAFSQVKLLQSIKHPNIVTLIDMYYDEQMGNLCLILELADEGVLSEKIRACSENRQFMKEEEIWYIIKQITSGLIYLHEKNILHRDIKASNVLIFDDNVVKISDLNVSTTLQNLNFTRTGTLTYASPQIWKGQNYDNKSDIWSFGCLIYELMSLKKPFQAEKIEDLSKKVLKCQYEKLSEKYSRELRDLVSFMIQMNPRLRPSAKTISRMCLNRKGLKRQASKAKVDSQTPIHQRKYSEACFQLSDYSPQKSNAVLKRLNTEPASRKLPTLQDQIRKINSIKPNRVTTQNQESKFSYLPQYYTRGFKNKRLNKRQGMPNQTQPQKIIQNSELPPNYISKRVSKIVQLKRVRRYTHN